MLSISNVSISWNAETKPKRLCGSLWLVALWAPIAEGFRSNLSKSPSNLSPWINKLTYIKVHQGTSRYIKVELVHDLHPDMASSSNSFTTSASELWAGGHLQTKQIKQSRQSSQMENQPSQPILILCKMRIAYESRSVLDTSCGRQNARLAQLLENCDGPQIQRGWSVEHITGQNPMHLARIPW